jgi:hypothetical protein
MSEQTFRYDEQHIDAKLRAERDRLVKALRDLADRIDRAPLDRITGGLAWMASTIETLVQTIERTLRRGAGG